MRWLVLVVLLAVPAWAHHFFGVLRDGKVVIQYKDPHDPEVVARSQVLDLVAYRADGSVCTAQLGQAGADLCVDAPGAALIALRLDGGYWTKTGQGYRRGGKSANPGGIHSKKCVYLLHLVMAPGGVTSRPHGEPIEIGVMPVGGDLDLTVWDRDQPMGDQRVDIGHDGHRVRTDASGHVRVRGDEGGLVNTKREVPVADDPEADGIEYTAVVSVLGR